MSPFSHLIRFECDEDGSSLFADLGGQADGPPSPGTKIDAFASIEDLTNKVGGKYVTIRRVCLPLRLFWRSLRQQSLTCRFSQLLAPLPLSGVPIYCVGLNYRSHAKEAGVWIPLDSEKSKSCFLIQNRTNQLPVPSYPPLWTKPSTSLALPGEDIPINDFLAQSLLDYEVRVL